MVAAHSPPDPISPEEIARVDALYQPFAPLSEWMQHSVDLSPWNHYRSLLDEERSRASADDFRQAVDVAVRAAATDTGAIEGLYTVDRGFTMSVAEQAANWEALVRDEKGGDVADLVRAQFDTYELVLDAATGRTPVSEAWIRRLHEEICRPQRTYLVHTPIGQREQPLSKGKYKDHPNHVRLPDDSYLAFAPVSDTPTEMTRLVEELRSGDAESAHPVVQAAYAHHALTAIHPFADGNGRVARALASLYLFRAASIPLLVFADQRDEYLEALARADAEDRAPFLSFVLDCVLSTIELVVDTVRSGKVSDPESAVRRLREILTAQQDLSHVELDQVASRIQDHLKNLISERLKHVSLPPGVETSFGSTDLKVPEPKGYRQIIQGGPKPLTISIKSPSPARASVKGHIRSLVAKEESTSLPTFRLERRGPRSENSESFEDLLEIRLRQAHPSFSTSLERRLSLFARRTVGDLVDELSEEAEAALRRSGY